MKSSRCIKHKSNDKNESEEDDAKESSLKKKQVSQNDSSESQMKKSEGIRQNESSVGKNSRQNESSCIQSSCLLRKRSPKKSEVNEIKIIYEDKVNESIVAKKPSFVNNLKASLTTTSAVVRKNDAITKKIKHFLQGIITYVGIEPAYPCP